MSSNDKPNNIILIKKELLAAIKVFVFTWILMIILFVSRVFWGDISLIQTFKDLKQVASSFQFHISVLYIFVFLYLVFITIRYCIRTFKKRGVIVMLKRLGLRILAPLFVVFVIFKLLAFNTANEGYEYEWDYSLENNSGKSNNHFATDGKHRGMSVFGWRRQVDHDKAINELVKNNIEWVAVIPFFDQENETAPTIRGYENISEFTRRDSTFIRTINELHDKGIHVMLKPHLWLFSGWRSNLNFSTEREWDIWFESYRTYMLHYARMAAATNVKVLCVGTELKTSIKQQPEKWTKLITEIKEIYNGKLTYAANWDDDLNEIGFWNQLDFIGVQAYFPLTKNKNPELEEIRKGWAAHISFLKQLSHQYKKPILFTEIGYRSDASTTIKPWEWNSVDKAFFSKKSDRTQQLAYEAMFQELWHKDWFAGTYIWQWNTQSKEENAKENLDFSPRFKPAQNTLAKWYGTSGKQEMNIFKLFKEAY